MGSRRPSLRFLVRRKVTVKRNEKRTKLSSKLDIGPHQVTSDGRPSQPSSTHPGSNRPKAFYHLEQAEETLRAEAQDLDSLVEERLRQLGDAARVSAIGETAAMVGHDLRNPLQTITNTIHLAKKRAEAGADPNLVGLLDTVQEQVNSVNKILIDLRDYARTMKPAFSKVEVSKLVGDALSSLSVPGTLKITTDFKNEIPAIEGDPGMLGRALTNILTNAVQATPNGGRISITASHEEKRVSISVKDDGEGMNQAVLERIFDPLLARGVKGNGLGLPIAKRIVDAHQGTIRVDSGKGRGTTFIIELPLEQKRRVG